jgi:8-oxo-dGTP pyrophosphatase MutT (NUDIX family)
MRREFWEEAGVRVEHWEECVVLTGVPTPADPRGWEGHFFRAFGDLEACHAKTDEALEIHPASPVPAAVIPNLRWMIPLMLDEDVIARAYRVRVREATVL